MGRIDLAAMVCAALAATGCVTVEQRVPKTAVPDLASGYVGGIFSKDTVAGFGFGLHEVNTGREYVLGVEEKDVGLIAVPPGKYRVAYWVSFALTHEQLTKQEIPASHPLGRTFDVGPGQVVLLGRWSADRAMSTYMLSSTRIAEAEAVAALRASYPGFGAAPATCFVCTAGGGVGAAVPAPRDLTTVERACDDGRAASCTDAGRLHSDSQGPQDHARAAALFRKGCDGGDAAGCRLLGDAYGSGRGVEKDAARSARYVSKGCDLGDPGACTNLGAKLSNGSGVDKDEARAAALFKRACDAGNAGGCFNLGLALRNGRGVPKDDGAAPALYAKACDGGVARGCTILAGLHQRGDSVTKDLPRAAALYERGCNGGDAQGCYYVGYLAQRGLGTQRDAQRAAAYYKRACDAGEVKACERLSTSKDQATVP
jgi:TPR repeat protein